MKAVLLLASGALGLFAWEATRQGVQPPVGTPVANAAALAPLTAMDRAFYRETAALAWKYLDDNYNQRTGLVAATPQWLYTTVWDIGSQLLGYYSAKELGFITADEYDRRMRRTLDTVERLDLYRDFAYNRVYSITDASAGTGEPGSSLTGWSATDLGRFFVALKIISEREPQYAAQAERIVGRVQMRRVIRGGYLLGEVVGRQGQQYGFQEGRIGYEQYAAAGYAFWGADVANALRMERNAARVEVFGARLLRDRRGKDRLVSEPFILMGLELGLTGQYRDLAANMLRAQEERYRRTGQITIATEDAVGVPPHYFYYYCVYCNGRPFVIDLANPGSNLNSPRWVSTKGAFGWHALMPTEYTERAMNHVLSARHAERGWASGVYEGSGRSTHTYDVNTASVLLTVALYQLRGGVPLIQPAAVEQ